MSKNSSIIEKIGHKLDEYLDGYFELYKKTTNRTTSKSNAIYQHILNLPDGGINGPSNPRDYFFGIFLCLIMRYTQSEILTGICLQNINNSVSVLTATVPFDDKSTFNDIIKLISNEKATPAFEAKWLDAILQKTAHYNDCLFAYSDSLDSDVNINQTNIQTDACFQIVATDEKTFLNIIYNENVYEKDYICRIALHYEQLLSYALKNPERLIYNATYLTADEEKLLVDVWNCTDCQFPTEYCIHHLFEQQVMADPDAIAVYYEGHTMTRGILNKRANQLAHRLIQSGVKKAILLLYIPINQLILWLELWEY